MKRAARFLLGCIAFLMLGAAGRGQVTLSLTSPAQNVDAAGSVIFCGTLVNTSGAAEVDLNDIAIDLTAGDAAAVVLNSDSFYSNVPGILLPGETYTGPIFSISIPASAAGPQPANYSGTVTVMGGAGIFAAGNLAQAGFSLASPAEVIVTERSASLAANAAAMVINGFGFDSVAVNNTVVFNDNAAGYVTSACSTSLTVTFSAMPSAPGRLTAVVTTDGVSSGAPVQVAAVVPVVVANTIRLASNASSLIINGFGFDPTAANNTVSFSNGATGSVANASPNSLVVDFSAPLTAGELTAVVSSSGVSSGSPAPVATIAPVVTTSAVSLPANAETITINGFGFDPNQGNNAVLFNNGAVGSVTGASAASLTVTFSTPPTAGELTAEVTTNGVGSGAPSQVATVTPIVTSSTTILPGNAAGLVIDGIGFDPTAANDTVLFNDSAIGRVTAATGTSLTVVFSTSPAATGPLTAVVASDGVSNGAPVPVALVDITPAVAVNDVAYAVAGASVDIDVLANDSNPDLDVLTITSVTQGAHGEVIIIDHGGLLRYAPHGPVRSDQFTYTMSDGQGGTSTATVFVYGLYASAAGAYNGLAQAPSGATPTNTSAGLIRLTINGATGTFTGFLALANDRFPLTGAFASSGLAGFGENGAPSIILKPKNQPALELALQLVLGAPIVQITGALTQNSAPFALISADRALYTAAAKPTAPLIHVPANLLGNYTVVFAPKAAPNNGLLATQYPQGAGIGLLTVTSAGNARLAGTLADGTPFTYSNALSSTNHWPFYVALAGGAGSMSGLAAFETNAMLMTDLDGLGLSWFKPANVHALVYPAGWAKGIRTDLLGSKYHLPSAQANQSILPGLSLESPTGNATAFLAGADLPTPGITQAFNVSPKNAATAVLPNPNKLLLTLDPSGAFTGSFLDTASKTAPAMKGVIFQDRQQGLGFFLSGGQSGMATLAPR